MLGKQAKFLRKLDPNFKGQVLAFTQKYHWNDYCFMQ